MASKGQTQLALAKRDRSFELTEAQFLTFNLSEIKTSLDHMNTHHDIEKLKDHLLKFLTDIVLTVF